MRLHFSIGGYDNRRTARFRQGIHFSITHVLFADQVHRRAGVDNKFSFFPEIDPQNLERRGYAHEVHLGKFIRAKDFVIEF